MQLGIVVNDLATEVEDYTTTDIALAANNLGHEVWYIEVGGFTYDGDEMVHAHATAVPGPHSYHSGHTFLNSLRSDEAYCKRITLDSLDVLMLRNDPAEDVNTRPWARLAAINFGRLAMRHDVIVVNDPNGLTQGVNKMYLQYFPKDIRPTTLISRDRDEIKAFIAMHGDWAVLKPLSGSGGHNVFLAQPEDKPNINQMIEAVEREGYVIAQEYLPAAVHGDTRLFLMNGRPLCSHGHYAALKRVRKPGDKDMRSNISAGAGAEKAVITETILQLAESVAPKLIQDGIFLAGLDIVGDKVMEINVFSPGGLHSASDFEERDFAKEIVHALERKLALRCDEPHKYGNAQLAII